MDAAGPANFHIIELRGGADSEVDRAETRRGITEGAGHEVPLRVDPNGGANTIAIAVLAVEVEFDPVARLRGGVAPEFGLVAQCRDHNSDLAVTIKISEGCSTMSLN